MNSVANTSAGSADAVATSGDGESEAEMLAQLQQRLQELEAARQNNQDSDADQLPGVGATDGTPGIADAAADVADVLGATNSPTPEFTSQSRSESASSLLDQLQAEQQADAQAVDSYETPAGGLSASDNSEANHDASELSAGQPTSLPENYSTPQSADELTFSEPIDEAPIDTAAILAKFGHSLDDDEDGTKTAFLDDDLSGGGMASPAAPPPITPSPSPYGGAESTHSPGSAPSSSFDDDDDESIDDYMAQLMARVGGSSQTPVSTIKPEPAKPEPAPEVQPTPSAPSAATEQQQGRRVPLDPSEFVPRAVAPEASSNLRALRAVANTSARSAIDRHQRRSFDNKAYICWFIAIVAAIVCFSMAFFAKEIVSLPTLVSMLALLISFFATINGLAFAAKAKVGVRATQQQLLASIEHVEQRVR